MNNFSDIEYPYVKLYYDFDKDKILKEIKNYKPVIYNNIKNLTELKKYNIKKFKNKYFIIKENYLKTEYITDLTDYFSENIRVKCKFKNNESSLEYWTKNKDKIIKKVLDKKQELTIYNIRSIIYDNIRQCNNFRITVVLAVLNYFKPKKYLDISAGWGDRLLGSIFSNVEYYESCDPNLDLHPCYKKMINTFVPKDLKKNYIIHKNGFLESKFKGNNFDIVFSSPPFFDLEDYSTFNKNSLVQHKTLRDWIDNFLLKSFVKAYNLLKKNGYMILYIFNNKDFAQDLFRLSNVMKYLGVIYFYESKPRKMYVWKKIDDKIIKKF